MPPKYDADGEKIYTEEERYLSDTFGIGYQVIEDDQIIYAHIEETTEPEDPDLIESLRAAIQCLPLRQGEIIQQRFFYGLTQQEVADNLGISQQSVHETEQSAYANLRAALLERGVVDDRFMAMLANRIAENFNGC